MLTEYIWSWNSPDVSAYFHDCCPLCVMTDEWGNWGTRWMLFISLILTPTPPFNLCFWFSPKQKKKWKWILSRVHSTIVCLPFYSKKEQLCQCHWWWGGDTYALAERHRSPVVGSNCRFGTSYVSTKPGSFLHQVKAPWTKPSLSLAIPFSIRHPSGHFFK